MRKAAQMVARRFIKRRSRLFHGWTKKLNGVLTNSRFHERRVLVG
jgi:hypothetical protein